MASTYTRQLLTLALISRAIVPTSAAALLDPPASLGSPASSISPQATAGKAQTPTNVSATAVKTPTQLVASSQIETASEKPATTASSAVTPVSSPAATSGSSKPSSIAVATQTVVPVTGDSTSGGASSSTAKATTSLPPRSTAVAGSTTASGITSSGLTTVSFLSTATTAEPPMQTSGAPLKARAYVDGNCADENRMEWDVTADRISQEGTRQFGSLMFSRQLGCNEYAQIMRPSNDGLPENDQPANQSGECPWTFAMIHWDSAPGFDQALGTKSCFDATFFNNIQFAYVTFASPDPTA